MSRTARTAKVAFSAGRPAAVAAPASQAHAAPNVDRINAINVGLMAVSAAIAWVVPFELFVQVRDREDHWRQGPIRRGDGPVPVRGHSMGAVHRP